MRTTITTLGIALMLGGSAFGQERIAGDGKDELPTVGEQEGEPTAEISIGGNVSEEMTLSGLEQAAMAEGCWATVYSAREFDGNSLTLVGPHELQNLKFDPGRDWTGAVRSIEVGPGAAVKLYDGEYFSALSYDLKADMAISDLHRRPFWGGIKSLVLECDSSLRSE